MCRVRFFICPMSKNIVDSVIEMNSPLLGLLPSRRQVDYNGGYVNNWNTKSFMEYVRSKSNIVVERDHAGVGQSDSNEYESYSCDSNLLNIIHIDPWKKYTFFEDGLKETIRNIEFIDSINKDVKFEIGTEESIRRFELKELVELVQELKIELNHAQFDKIQYICIQSGVGIDLVNKRNTGEFNLERLKLMVEVCKKFNKLSKEHNGDYLTADEIKLRFDNGLDALNIGPEIAQIETEIRTSIMSNSELDDFYNICLQSGKWNKWVTNDFDSSDKKKLIQVCGHYNFDKLDTDDNTNGYIKNMIKKKLNELLSYV